MKNTMNPWHEKNSIYRYSEARYNYPNDPVVVHRCVEVYQLFHGRYDYVLGDMTIAQRGGIDKSAIDRLLDGVDICSDKVAKHLTLHNHIPLSYSNYSKNWQDIDAKQRRVTK